MESTSALLPRIRAFFGLSQAALGRALRLGRVMVSQVERGLRSLPLAAGLPQAALTLAYQRTPPAPPAEAPDVRALLRQARADAHRAQQLEFELSLLPERAAWARRRLAALPALTAALAPAGGPPPPWLAGFAIEARAELLRSGSTAQARLRARIAGLRAGAAALTQEADAAGTG